MVLKIKGMMCNHCAERVKRALLAVPGVINVTVSLADATATITQDSNEKQALVDAIVKAGYKVVSIK